MNLSKRMLGYLPIPNGGDGPRQNGLPATFDHLSRFLLPVLSIVSCILGIFIGAIINRHPPCVGGILQQPSIGSDPVPDIPLDATNVIFVYNRTFGESPWHSSSSDEAWDSIVPRMYRSLPTNYVYLVLHICGGRVCGIVTVANERY